MTPDWLLQVLRDKGVISESGLTRNARMRPHRDCGQLTLAGYDSDRASLDAWCDPYPLTADGEVQALLDERTTYHLWGGRLERRDRWTIRGIPAGSPSHPVFAEHRCRLPVPRPWRLSPPPPAPRPLEETW